MPFCNLFMGRPSYITTIYSFWRTSPWLNKLYNIQLQYFRAKFFYNDADDDPRNELFLAAGVDRADILRIIISTVAISTAHIQVIWH